MYFSGTDPASCYIPGEYESGMSKEPIEIVPVDSTITMRPEARIRFSKKYPIEMNVKVKELGSVHPDHMSKLLMYCKDDLEYNDHHETYGDRHLEHGIFKSSPTPEPDSNNDDLVLLRRDVDHHLSADRMEGVNSRLVGGLHSGWFTPRLRGIGLNCVQNMWSSKPHGASSRKVECSWYLGQSRAAIL